MTVRLLRLTARCPACGAPPKIRTMPDAVELYADHDPERALMTYQCHVRQCAAIYQIRVKDFTDAA